MQNTFIYMKNQWTNPSGVIIISLHIQVTLTPDTSRITSKVEKSDPIHHPAINGKGLQNGLQHALMLLSSFY